MSTRLQCGLAPIWLARDCLKASHAKTQCPKVKRSAACHFTLWPNIGSEFEPGLEALRLLGASDERYLRTMLRCVGVGLVEQRLPRIPRPHFSAKACRQLGLPPPPRDIQALAHRYPGGLTTIIVVQFWSELTCRDASIRLAAKLQHQLVTLTANSVARLSRSSPRRRCRWARSCRRCSPSGGCC
jgi:hypothetical protein